VNSHYCTLQDAHEFLNFLLNELVDILEKEHNAARESLQNLSLQKNSDGPIDGQPNGSHKELAVTWVHKCFQVRFHSFVL
jgi:ubiquitin carboxyl-terminal hydrolase 12/46